MSQDLPREVLSLHLDRSYYLAGDKICFALYCTEAGSGQPSRISALANVELINQQGEIVKREKIKLQKGCGSGFIQIPNVTNSGEHMIRSYTSLMRNFGPGSFHYTPVMIIHPEKKFTPMIGLKGIPDTSQYIRKPSAVKKAGAEISGLKESYRARDTITFTLKYAEVSGSPESATVSISIAGTSSQYPSGSMNPGEHLDLPDKISGKENILFLPDKTGIQLCGTITRPVSGEPVINREVLLSFIDSITDIYSVRSDSGGSFLFELNGILGRKDVIIQAPGEDQDILISIHPDRSIERIPQQVWISLNKEGLEKQYRELLLEKQLMEAYGIGQAQAESDDDPPGKQEDLPFYGRPDHDIILANYVRLPVMEEVFRELGKRVFLSREKGKYKVLILDLETNRIIGDRPYYFIDGIPFFDSEKLLSIDPSSIKSISLKSRKYFMGDLIMDGIIDMRSKNGDAALVEFPRSAIREYFQGFQHPLPSRKKEIDYNSRIPLYKTSLLFDSLVETGPGKSADFELIAPDSKGNYTISIRGITIEGLPVQKDLSFQVK